jgi:protein O-GlcNAc transferase
MDTETDDYQEKLDQVLVTLGENNLEEAIAMSDRLREQYPERGESYYLLGLVSFVLGDRGKALSFMDEGFKVASDILEFARALAALNAMTGNLNDMNYYMKLTLVLDSNEFLSRVEPESFANPEANLERVGLPTQLVNAWVRFHQRRYLEALKYCDAYIQLQPDDDEGHRLVGKIHLEQDQPVKALTALRKAHQLAPASIENCQDLAEAYLSVGMLGEAHEVLRQSLESNPDVIEIHQQMVRAAGYGDQTKRDSIKVELSRLAKLLEQSEIDVPTNHIHQIADHEKLFVGILINERAMAQSIDFLDAWFQVYEDAGMRITVYQQYERPNVGTSRLKSLVDDWRESFDLDDVTLKHVITNDGIDVLVDLCGVYPGNRQRLLAGGLGVARVGWLQGANVPLLEALDFTLSDENTMAKTTDPESNVECISLGAGQIAFGGGSVMLEGEAVDTGKAGPVFGAILDVAAIMPSIPLWADVLRAVPDSSMVLARTGEVEPELADYIKAQFVENGISERIGFVAGASGRSSWSELLARVDVLLDSIIVSDAPSICDALWMGVPVVTLAPKARTGVAGASIIATAGCEEWIASDHGAYVSIAGKLVSERKKLMMLRDQLRDRIKGSALCDLKGFADRMESALRQIHTRGLKK